MPPVVLWILSAAAGATLVATVVVLAPGEGARVWVRRLFLVLVNLSPLSLGFWRSEFSRRETFLAAWFLAFVLLLPASLALWHRLAGFNPAAPAGSR